MSKDNIKNVHPGKILQKEFLDPMDLSQNEAALKMGVHPRRINEIVLGKRSITADTALRLSEFFDTTSQFWMNLQSEYDLRRTKKEKGEELKKEVKPPK
ncbi:MAG: HigA family addiction module antitoxin [Candidatus Magasanikbacteria bacterium]